MSIPAHSGYRALSEELDGAFEQAACGKGKERHAMEGAPIEQQYIVGIAEFLTKYLPYTTPPGTSYHLGQAIKKLLEAEGLPDLADRVHERHGAMNYIAARNIMDRRRIEKAKEVQYEIDTMVEQKKANYVVEALAKELAEERGETND